MQIRSLDPIADRRLVDAFFREVADYIRLERGEAPDPAVTRRILHRCAARLRPGRHRCRLGLFDAGRLIGVAELAFGYPDPDDAYHRPDDVSRRRARHGRRPDPAAPSGSLARARQAPPASIWPCWTPTRAAARSGNVRASALRWPTGP